MNSELISIALWVSTGGAGLVAGLIAVAAAKRRIAATARRALIARHEAPVSVL